MRVQNRYVTSAMRAGQTGVSSGKGFGRALSAERSGVRVAPESRSARGAEGVAESRGALGVAESRGVSHAVADASGALTGAMVSENATCEGSGAEGARPALRYLEGQVETILSNEQALHSAIERAEAGDGFSQGELLRLQARVYAHSQRVDVATRVVDRSANALRQLLNTQL